MHNSMNGTVKDRLLVNAGTAQGPKSSFCQGKPASHDHNLGEISDTSRNIFFLRFKIFI